MNDARKRIAYGCRLGPGDPGTKLVWLGRLLGYSACQTAAGCWHGELVTAKSEVTSIAAEVCMPSEHHLIEVLKMFDGLTGAKQLEFVTEHLPRVAAETDAKERAEIRGRILAP